MRVAWACLSLLVVASRLGCGRAEPRAFARVLRTAGQSGQGAAEAATTSLVRPRCRKLPGRGVAEGAAPAAGPAAAAGLKRMIIYTPRSNWRSSGFPSSQAGSPAWPSSSAASSPVRRSAACPASSPGQWRIRVPSVRFQALLDAIRPFGEIARSAPIPTTSAKSSTTSRPGCAKPETGRSLVLKPSTSAHRQARRGVRRGARDLRVAARPSAGSFEGRLRPC